MIGKEAEEEMEGPHTRSICFQVASLFSSLPSLSIRFVSFRFVWSRDESFMRASKQERRKIEQMGIFRLHEGRPKRAQRRAKTIELVGVENGERER